MDFSLSLLRHRLAARRNEADEPFDDPPRPEGPVFRVHFCPGPDHDGTRRLLLDFHAAHPNVAFVASGETALDDIALTTRLSVETPAQVRAHLDHWRPDAMIFSGPDPHPILWTEARARNIALIAVEADPARYPIALVRPLQTFDFVHATGPDPRLTLRNATVSPLARTPPPPPVIDSDLDDLSSLLKTRPVWLSTDTPRSEFDRVLSAHAEAAKLSHRLLLILELRDSGDADIIRNLAGRDDWRCQFRSDGDELLPDTQIFVGDEPGEIGLWTRLASVSYLGGSFTTGVARDPLVPASLGSVIVHGPRHGAFDKMLRTLDGTRGAQPVAIADRLGGAIEMLLAPDRSAEIAHEAWDIATRGAEASNLAAAALEGVLSRTGRA